MSDHIELTEPCGLLTVPGVHEYVCRLEPVGEGTVNVTVCAPTEPIVRCRDCKLCDERYGRMLCRRDMSCDEIALDVKPDGFCSWACRREKRES